MRRNTTSSTVLQHYIPWSKAICVIASARVNLIHHSHLHYLTFSRRFWFEPLVVCVPATVPVAATYPVFIWVRSVRNQLAIPAAAAVSSDFRRTSQWQQTTSINCSSRAFCLSAYSAKSMTVSYLCRQMRWRCFGRHAKITYRASRNARTALGCLANASIPRTVL